MKLTGKLDEAKDLFQRCYKGYTKIYGADHSDTIKAKALVDSLS